MAETVYSLTKDTADRVLATNSRVEATPVGPAVPTRITKTPIPFQFRRFELATSFSLASGDTYRTAVAYFLQPDGTVEDGTSSSHRPPFVVTDITNFRFGLGSGTLSPPHHIGSQGTAYHPHDVDRWEVVDMSGREIGFELKDDMPLSDDISVEPGQFADAYLVLPDGSLDESTVFEIHDDLGVHRGRAKDKYSSPHHHGSRGTVKFDTIRGLFFILTMQPSALQIMGVVDETGEPTGFTKADDTFEMGSVYVMQPIGAIITDFDPAENVTVQNRKFDGDDGKEVIATWDEYDVDWKALDVICPV